MAQPVTPFAREFMARHGIPHPDFRAFDDLEAARSHLRERRGACVVKAEKVDGKSVLTL